MLSAAVTPLQTISLHSNSQSLIVEDPEERVNAIDEKIQRLFAQKLSRIFIPTIKHWLKEFKHQPYLVSALKGISVPICAGLIGLEGIASLSSLILLARFKFGDALSANIATRVEGANNITNSGAIFAAITEAPAYAYVFYQLVIRNAHCEALREALHEAYRFCINEEPTLSQDMHEELYQRHISRLKGLRITRFYLNPDLLSRTGAIYGELAPVLQEIDQKINQGVPVRDLGKKCIEEFGRKSCTKKISKIMVAAFAIFAMALACFLAIENWILLVDTPVRDLVSKNKDKQVNEAFYLTQLGGLFCSITAFGVSLYIMYRLFVQTAYKTTMRENTNTYFREATPGTLSAPAREALKSIKHNKLE